MRSLDEVPRSRLLLSAMSACSLCPAYVLIPSAALPTRFFLRFPPKLISNLLAPTGSACAPIYLLINYMPGCRASDGSARTTGRATSPSSSSRAALSYPRFPRSRFSFPWSVTTFSSRWSSRAQRAAGPTALVTASARAASNWRSYRLGFVTSWALSCSCRCNAFVRGLSPALSKVYQVAEVILRNM